eukprot:836157-Rhodomonas_salina.1
MPDAVTCARLRTPGMFPGTRTLTYPGTRVPRVPGTAYWNAGTGSPPRHWDTPDWKTGSSSSQTAFDHRNCA